ncbi:MAG TPA: hypothetical protein ENI51_00020 [Candidatus Atribacteria bacterium]|nr:hypothetical protein [Candidatus Atribacteria bacterium]
MPDESEYLQVIKESFNPKLISALYKNFSDQYVALQELIDNAVDDRIKGKKLIVTIDIKDEDNKIVIKNHNGKGMGIEDLMNFFTWGSSDKRKRIGRYGQGGKAALGYLAKSFKIKSHPAGSYDGYFIKVDDWENRDSGFKEFKIEKYQSSREFDVGSVALEISNLKKRFQKETIKKKISDIYRPLIMKGKVDFFLDGEKILCPPVNYDEGTKRVFSLDFNIGSNHYNITGEYGIVSDIRSLRGGFNIYQYGRKVAHKEYFGHMDPSKRWNLERLYGELYIDFDVPLLMNKTDIDRDSTLWRKIKELMYNEIKPTIREAIDYRAPTKKEKGSIRRITKRLKKKEGKQGLSLELTNYGPNLLFKIEKDKKGNVILKINREHTAYKKWSSTAYGKDLYAVMIYSLYSATQRMSKAEAKKFLNCFSESLKEHTYNLL